MVGVEKVERDATEMAKRFITFLAEINPSLINVCQTKSLQLVSLWTEKVMQCEMQHCGWMFKTIDRSIQNEFETANV